MPHYEGLRVAEILEKKAFLIGIRVKNVGELLTYWATFKSCHRPDPLPQH